MRRDELRDRLSGWEVPVRDSARGVHRAALARAIIESETTAPSPARRVRRRVAWVAALLVGVMVPAGAALAAEDAVPGDLLYPIKKVTEEIRSWWDDDIAAEHRVEELEVLVERGRSLEDLGEEIAAAEAELLLLQADHPLRDRFDRVVDGRGGDGGSAASGEDPFPEAPSGGTSSLPVASSTTTAPASDGPRDEPAREEATSGGEVSDLTIRDLEWLSRISSGEFALDALPVEIRELVVRLRAGGQLTTDEAHVLIQYFQEHPELLETTDVPRTTTSVPDTTTTTTTITDRPSDDPPDDETTTTTTRPPPTTTTAPADGTTTTTTERGGDRPADRTTTTTTHGGGDQGDGGDGGHQD